MFESWGGGGKLTLVFLPCSPGENLEEGQISLEFLRGVWAAEGLDCWHLEQLGEEVCLWVGGGICDEVCD